MIPGMYIRSTASISPQASFEALLTDPAGYTGDRLSCIEPDYTAYIDVRQIRRMSRVIKMGVAAALECLKDTGVEQPGAIITGTAYGCLADTDAFLSRLVEFKEELLTPTSFIQSTHNTVAGQIALVLKCHHHNNTFVHRGLSFESALLDAQTMMAEGEIADALVGGIDEIIPASHAVLKRFGLYRENGNSLALSSTPGKGTMGGEGAAFFLLSTTPAEGSFAILNDFTTFYKPSGPQDATAAVGRFLAAQPVDPAEIDLVLTGRNGNQHEDEWYEHVEKDLFAGIPAMSFKHFCGEYPTATAFGLWLAANMLRAGKVPGAWAAKAPRRILLYNHYQQIHHSLFLLSVC